MVNMSNMGGNPREDAQVSPHQTPLHEAVVSCNHTDAKQKQLFVEDNRSALWIVTSPAQKHGHHE